jgi:hypothetical protein
MRISRNSIVFTTVALLVLGCARPAAQPAPPAQVRTFASPGQAAQALYEAERTNDESAARAILGTGPELTSAGSDIDDKAGREHFVKKYQEMHRLVHEPDGTTILHIGAENWPFPVPLMVKQGRWYFDSDAGGQEVLAREIGHNETSAVEVCQAFVGAGTGPAAGNNPSGDRIQPFASTLRSAGNANATDRRSFEGYYFRVVPAELGAVALVAYPAAYRTSGVMTFVLTKDGAVYEKDLGPQTATLAQQLRGEPKTDWVLVE